MTIPRQIVYPLNFFSIFRRKSNKEIYSKFIFNLKKIFGEKYFYFPIGRARMGIYLTVKYALKKNNSKLIAMSPYTIPDVINMALVAGAQPIFFDYLKNSFDIDPEVIEELVTKNKLSAIIITHYHTNQKKTDKIRNICQENDVYLIEDCAIASLSPTLKNNFFNTAQVFSFSSFKVLNYFYGGLIITEDKFLADFLNLELSNFKEFKQIQYFSQALKAFIYAFATNKLIFKYYTSNIYKIFSKRKIPISHRKPAPIKIGQLNETYFTLPSPSAIYELNSKIQDIDAHNLHRRSISKLYHKSLSEYSLGKSTIEDFNKSSCYNYPLIFGKNRDDIYYLLMQKGFDVGRHLYENCHQIKEFKKFSGSSHNLEETLNGLIWLPTHIRVTEIYANKLIKYLLKILNEKNLTS